MYICIYTHTLAPPPAIVLPAKVPLPGPPVRVESVASVPCGTTLKHKNINSIISGLVHELYKETIWGTVDSFQNVHLEGLVTEFLHLQGGEHKEAAGALGVGLGVDLLLCMCVCVCTRALVRVRADIYKNIQTSDSKCTLARSAAMSSKLLTLTSSIEILYIRRESARK